MAGTVEFVPNQAEDGGDHRPRPVDDHGALLRGRLGGHDLGHQPEPRGHHHGRDPRHAEGGHPQPGARLRGRARSTSRPGTTPRRASSTRSSSSSRARSATRRSTARATGPASASTPTNGQPITTNEWVDRLAPKAAAVVAVGTCATYGGIPAMKNNPTGAMGLPDYLGWNWKSKAGLPDREHPRLPGAAGQHDRDAAVPRLRSSAGMAPVPELDEQLRPKWLFGRTVRESCNRAGFSEEGDFATEYGADHRCLVKLGCKGPVVKCNVPVRGWVNGIGGCPNVGGICMACTMPGFPDKYMPFMDADPWGEAGGERHEVHLRPGPAVLPPAQHQDEVRQGAGVAAQPGASSPPATRSAGRKERPWRP